MPLRPNRIAAALCVVVAAAVTGSALAASAATPDVTVLLRRATTLVHSKAQFKKAVLLEADGTTGSGKKVTKATGIVNWRFVFNNQGTQGSKYASLFIKVRSGKLGKITGNRGPFLEDQMIYTVPKMTLTQAVLKLRRAGYRSGFYNVTLRKPLFPGVTEASYFFGFGSQAKHPFVRVGTRTGKVQPTT